MRATQQQMFRVSRRGGRGGGRGGGGRGGGGAGGAMSGGFRRGQTGPTGANNIAIPSQAQHPYARHEQTSAPPPQQQQQQAELSDYELLQQYEQAEQAALATNSTAAASTSTTAAASATTPSEAMSDFEMLQQYEREQAEKHGDDAYNPAEQVYDPDEIAKPVVRAPLRQYRPLPSDDTATTTPGEDAFAAAANVFATQQLASLLEGTDETRAKGLDPTQGVASGWTSVPLAQSFAVVNAAPDKDEEQQRRQRAAGLHSDDDDAQRSDDDSDGNKSSFLPTRLAKAIASKRTPNTGDTTAATTPAATTTTSADPPPLQHLGAGRVHLKSEKKAPTTVTSFTDADNDDKPIAPIVFKKRKSKKTGGMNKRKKLLADDD